MKTPLHAAILGFIFILLPMTISTAQSLEYVNSALWTGANDIEIVGNLAYCSHPLGLMIFDVSNPANPILCGKLACTGIGVKIAIYGNYAYIATKRAGIQIANISNIYSPQIVDSYPCDGELVGIKIQGEYAYILNYSSGLLILNISNPTNPELAGSYSPGLTGTTLEISENYAYIGYEFRHLHIVDISDPTYPSMISDLSNLFDFMSQDVIAIKSKDSTLIVTTGYFEVKYNMESEYLYVFDISNPAIPECDGRGMVNYYSDQISISGNYAYLGSEMGINVYDISNLSNEMNPVSNYHHETESNRVSSMTINNNSLFVMFLDSFEALDISTPISPVLSGRLGLSSYTIRVALQGNYAYSCGFGWLNTIDISSTEMAIVSRLGWFYGKDMAIAGNYCYLPRAYHGLGFVNIENPENPFPVDTINVVGGLTEISVMGNIALGYRSDFFSNENNVATIINLNNPSTPTISGVYNTGPGCIFHDALIWGNYVYIGAEAQPNIRIVNIEDTGNPVQVNAMLDGHGIVRHGMCTQDHYLFVNAGAFYILDLINPASPQIVSQLPISADILSVTGRYAFLAKNDSLMVVDISDVSNPILCAGCRVIGNYINGIASNDSLCIVSVLDGIAAYKLNPAQSIDESLAPEEFFLINNYPNPFNAQTTLSYMLPETGPVNITVYNLIGQKVAVLENGIILAGEHRLTWNAGNMPSGVYFAKVQAGNKAESIKMTVMK